MTEAAARLLRHLNDNTWTSVEHAKSLGYEEEIKELVAAGLVTEQMLAGTPVIVIGQRTDAIHQTD